jgi:HEAT repeat protein
VRQAREVFDTTVAASSEHRVYAVSIAAGSGSPHAREFLLTSIGGDDYQAAVEAIRGLGDEPPPEAAEPLAAAFAEKRGALKLLAAAALARLGDAEALAWLDQQLEVQGGALPPTAMVALVEGGRREPVEQALRGLLASENATTRNEAYVVLAEIHEPWAAQVLLEGLDKEFGEERATAIEALGRCGEASAAEAIERWVNTQGLVFATLEALGRLGDEESAGTVAQMADHEEALVRAYAGAALWRLGHDEEARAALEPLLAAEEAGTREVLAEQLEGIASAEAGTWLGQLARDEAKQVRVAALRSLVSREDGGLEALLLELAGDPEYEVGAIALGMLAERGSPEAIEELATLLEDPNPYRAMTAAHAVLAIHSRQGGAAGA